jgi:hypothetical protein
MTNFEIEKGSVVLGVTQHPDVVNDFNRGREPAEVATVAAVVYIRPVFDIRHVHRLGISYIPSKEDVAKIAEGLHSALTPEDADYVDAQKDLNDSIQNGPSGFIKKNTATLTEVLVWRSDPQSRGF